MSMQPAIPDLSSVEPGILPDVPGWKPLENHPRQAEAWASLFVNRFNVIAAGRRSGKTIIAKRWMVTEGLAYDLGPGGLGVLCAPTRDQAKEIYWKESGESLPEMVPPWAIADVSESDLSITLLNGFRLRVLGMDKPHRIEGVPIDRAVFDEIADMKRTAWGGLRPGLATRGREGRALFIGKPRGRNHFHKMFNDASAGREGWAAFTWKSSELLSAAEIESAKADMDELTFQQEFEASFMNFEGLAYYTYQPLANLEVGLRQKYYDPEQPLIFAFDFNVAPGCAEVGQEIWHEQLEYDVTAWIGEVCIPRNSNTPAICRRLIHDWGKHRGDVYCYGDPTGGNRGSAKIAGSDIDLIRDVLRPHFGARLKMRFDRQVFEERPRVNALCSRLCAASGKVGMKIDPLHCPELVLDMEGVVTLKGGSGELDKQADLERTHYSDAVGYYCLKRFPVHRDRVVYLEI